MAKSTRKPRFNRLYALERLVLYPVMIGAIVVVGWGFAALLGQAALAPDITADEAIAWTQRLCLEGDESRRPYACYEAGIFPAGEDF